MIAWEELSRDEESALWSRFDADFDFTPSVRWEDFPGIREPRPSETYSIASIYDGDELRYARLNADLQQWGLRAFQKLASPTNDWLYVLDWQHQCYRFFPHIPFELSEYNEWTIPLLPNGDYYIFLAKDFSWGVFGHPWEQTMCVFGERLLATLNNERPELLTKLVRSDGRTV